VGVVLHDPTSKRLLGAQTISEIGDFVGLAALILLAYHKSGSLLASAGIFAARSIPSLLVGTVFSGWLDVPPRRTALVWLTLAGASVTTFVVVLPTTAAALGAAALLGAIRTAASSVTAGAAVDGLGDDVRASYYAFSSAVNQASQVIGFVAGATIALLIGARAALGFDVVTYLLAVVVLWTLPLINSRPRTRRPPPFQGVRIIASTPVLALVTPVVWATVFATAVPETFAPSLTHGSQLPILMAAFPFGTSVMAALLARREFLDRLSNQLMLALLFAVGFGWGAAILSTGANRWWLVPANFVAGLGSTWTVGARTTFALNTPPQHMAQVEATAVSANVLLEGLGVLALAAIGQQIGAVASFTFAAALVSVAVAVALGVVRTRFRVQPDLTA
jgi:MFS family permease